MVNPPGFSRKIVVKHKEIRLSVSRKPYLFWSERHDLNVRPLPPQGSALAKLSYAPLISYAVAKVIIYSDHQKVKEILVVKA